MPPLDEFDEPEYKEKAPPSPHSFLPQLRAAAVQADDWAFNVALAKLWNAVVVEVEPVRSWRELAAAPVGCCKGAVTGDELACFVALMVGTSCNFKPLDEKPTNKLSA